VSQSSASVAVVEAVAWTAIGLLAVAVFGSFAGLYYLGTRIDAQGTDLGGRIDAQGADLGGRISAQGADLGGRISAQGADLGHRIDGLSARIDSLSGRMDQHLERHTG
jgi:hypothetical protein